MKPTIFSILIFISFIFGSEPVVIKLDSKPELFTVDKLGNCYVYQNNQLKKYSARGKLVAQFSRLEAGKLESIDASDPIHLLLFYQEFNQLLFLDKHLNQKGKPIYINELQLNSVSAVCKSKQMGIWLYDEYENKLIHYGFNPKGIIQTINLNIFNNELSDINFMLELGNELYMNQNNKAVWVFDQFGSKLNKLDIQINNNFQVINNYLIYNNGSHLHSVSMITENNSEIKINGFESFDEAHISNNHIYVLKSDSITIFESPKFKN